LNTPNHSNKILNVRSEADIETLKSFWNTALEILLSGKDLPARYRDHGLTGQWAGFRDCHLKPDLVLIYQHA
jgi:mRNA interferase YafQ